MAIMSEKKSLRDPRETAGLLSETLKQGKLIWRLLTDRRVPVWPKLVIPATIAYILSPIDLLSDPILGLGQLDDIAVLLIGSKLFVELCPKDIVQHHLDDLSSVISASYRVVEDEREQEEPSEKGIAQVQEEPSRTELPPGSADDE